MANKYDFSGMWECKFTYVNANEPEGGVSEYNVKVYQTGNQLVLQSVQSKLGNYFVARLTLDGEFLTGTWQEQAQPDGQYKGQIYNGVGMLRIDASGDAMKGKIVEYNNDMDIIAGDWNIARKKT
jgi:hypothetical protein